MPLTPTPVLSPRPPSAAPGPGVRERFSEAAESARGYVASTTPAKSGKWCEDSGLRGGKGVSATYIAFSLLGEYGTGFFSPLSYY